ncbi:MAG TPA: amidohydrolase family protein [Acidobacteriaceae bacterium]|nr:amidohydrolase family protein [Acidobacteriaceae bacterium]
MLCVDAHHHLWDYSAEEYGWIGPEMAVLQRDFSPADLRAEMTAASVEACIAVQARETREETRWLLRLAHENAFIAGVVGWAPIAGAEFAQELEALAGDAKLKGLRHILQAQPDEYMLSDVFERGMKALEGSGLVYDILVYERQLKAAIALVDRHPKQVFVIDHLAKPKIAAHELEPWRTLMREMARREHVHCKLSGMTTEADWKKWTENDLHPYCEVILECFGAERLLAGSDWPVCTLAVSYRRWWQVVREMVKDLSDAEREKILGGNAVCVYGLNEEMRAGKCVPAGTPED